MRRGYRSKTRSKDRQTERGAVLLTTLLVMALMATLAVSILEDLRFAVKRAVNINDHAQADWYVKGAEAFAETLLQDALSKIESQDVDSYLLSLEGKPFIFPLEEGGAMRLSVRDGGDCVSLGALNQAPVQLQFTRLLIALGWTEFDAESLSAKVFDWQDTDSVTRQNGAEDFAYLGKTPAFRTANVAFSSVAELRSVEGVTAEIMFLLRPYLCARADTGSPKLSLNTLPVEKAAVLASLISEPNAYTLARQIIEDRPDGGYIDIEQLKTAPVLEDIDTKNIAFDLISFETEHIWIEAQILLGQSRRYLALEYQLDGSSVQRTYRRRSAEAFRPQPIDLSKPESNSEFPL